MAEQKSEIVHKPLKVEKPKNSPYYQAKALALAQAQAKREPVILYTSQCEYVKGVRRPPLPLKRKTGYGDRKKYAYRKKIYSLDGSLYEMAHVKDVFLGPLYFPFNFAPKMSTNSEYIDEGPRLNRIALGVDLPRRKSNHVDVL